MNIHAASNLVLDALPSTRGQESQHESTETDNERVARQFESVFLSMVLKEMRKTSSDDGLFAGDSADIYGGLFDQFLAQHISQGRSIGITELLGDTFNGKTVL